MGSDGKITFVLQHTEDFIPSLSLSLCFTHTHEKVREAARSWLMQWRGWEVPTQESWQYRSRWSGEFSSVQSLSRVPWTAACQDTLSITNSQSLPKLMSTESVMPSNHLILCRPLLLLPSIFPSIRVSSNESALRIRWPKYWSFSFSISPSNEHPGLISFRMHWLDLLAL